MSRSCRSIFATLVAAVLFGTAAPRTVHAQAASASTAAQSATVSATRTPAPQALPGPRLAPERVPLTPLLPGETQEREVNSVVRRANTITIPVVTLLLGIIILILLVD